MRTAAEIEAARIEATAEYLCNKCDPDVTWDEAGAEKRDHWRWVALQAVAVYARAAGRGVRKK